MTLVLWIMMAGQQRQDRRGNGLNGIIRVWNLILEEALDISCMVIRVDVELLNRRLALTQNKVRLQAVEY